MLPVYSQHSTIDRPTVGGIGNLPFERPGSCHRIFIGVLQHVHTVVGVGPVISREVNIPFEFAIGILDIVHFRRPDIGAVHRTVNRCPG
ncbi:hypothetical protein D3C75_866240 [compost metagenome]